MNGINVIVVWHINSYGREACSTLFADIERYPRHMTADETLEYVKRRLPTATAFYAYDESGDIRHCLTHI